MNRLTKYAILLVAAVFLGGCMTGPNYQRPAVALPGQFRGAPAHQPGLPIHPSPIRSGRIYSTIRPCNNWWKPR